MQAAPRNKLCHKHCLVCLLAHCTQQLSLHCIKWRFLKLFFKLPPAFNFQLFFKCCWCLTLQSSRCRCSAPQLPWMLVARNAKPALTRTDKDPTGIALDFFSVNGIRVGTGIADFKRKLSKFDFNWMMTSLKQKKPSGFTWAQTSGFKKTVFSFYICPKWQSACISTPTTQQHWECTKIFVP